MGRQKNVDMSIIPDDVKNKKEFEIKSQELKEKEDLPKAKPKKTKPKTKKELQSEHKLEKKAAKAGKPVEKLVAEKKVEKEKKIEKKEKTLEKEEKRPAKLAQNKRKKPLHGKKYRDAIKLIDRSKKYTFDEALEILPKTSFTKFTAKIESHFNLGIKPKEQSVRFIVELPYFKGKKKRIAVLTNKPADAKKAGADIAGEKDLLENIKKGKIDFDILLTTPDMMPQIAPYAKILGPKGLMPNPKSGTIVNNIANGIAEVTGGKVEVKSDASGNIHQVIGDVDQKIEEIKANFEELLKEIRAARPAGVKGIYIKSITLATTMGPGIKIDLD